MLNIFNKKKHYNTNCFLNLNGLNNKKVKNIKYFAKHFPPNNQEWSDSVFVYNKSVTNNIPVVSDLISNLVLSFFNMYFAFTSNINSPNKRISIKKRFSNKTFISNIITKHTNNKILITLFTYNREKFFLLNKLDDSSTRIKQQKLKETSTAVVNKISVSEIKKSLHYSYMYKQMLIKKNLNPMLNGSLVNKKESNETKLLVKTMKNSIVNIYYITNLFNSLSIHHKNYCSITFDLQNLYLYNNYILLLNSFKHKDFFLSHLKSCIKKLCNKDVEFNIINIKQLCLSSDLFIKVIANKLTNRKNSLLNVLNKSLSLVKLLFFNKHILLSQTLKEKKRKNVALVYKPSEMLNKVFYYNVINKYCLETSNELRKNVVHKLHNKNVTGIKLQAAGRLTKRLIASRAVSKTRYKGNMKSIDSSYKCLPTVMLKGNTQSHIQYTLVNSKVRNGSFGIRG